MSSQHAFPTHRKLACIRNYSRLVKMTQSTYSPGSPPALFIDYSGKQLLVATVVITTVTTLFLGVLRLYTRTLTTATRSWDDFLLLQALVLFLALAVVCFRISVILLYLRIFNNKAAKIGCWIAFTFVIAYGIITIVGAQLQCVPLQYGINRWKGIVLIYSHTIAGLLYRTF